MILIKKASINGATRMFAMFALLACRLFGGSPKTALVINWYSQGHDHDVLQWDCPVFAAYTNGVVVWRKDWACSISALATAAPKKPIPAVEALEALVAANNGKIFLLTAGTDAEITTVWCAKKNFKIIGNWRKPRLLESDDPKNLDRIEAVNERERSLWSSLPNGIRVALSQIKGLNLEENAPWRPEKLGLTLFPAGKSLGTAVAWPAEWPQSFVAVPGSAEIYYQELPGSMLHQLLDLVERDGKPKAVTFLGRSTFARVRLFFPAEAEWNVNHQP